MQGIREFISLSTIEYLPLADTLMVGSEEKADMTMATDYRKRAEECLEIAQTVRTPAQRTMLLHIAETWMNLAHDAEGNSSEKPRPANSRQDYEPELTVRRERPAAVRHARSFTPTAQVRATAVHETDAQGETPMSAQEQPGLPAGCRLARAELNRRTRRRCPPAIAAWASSRWRRCCSPPDLDDVIYGCENCGTEVKRTVKRT